MNDYLTNLAAKALNRMPVVQPRLASLFEPPPSEGRPPTGHELGSDSVPGDQLSDATASPASLTDLHPREHVGISSASTPSPQGFAAAAPPDDAVGTSAGWRQPPLLTSRRNDIALVADYIQPPATPTAAFFDRSADEGASLLSRLRQSGWDQGAESTLSTSSRSGARSGGEAALDQHPPRQIAESRPIAEDRSVLLSHHPEPPPPQPIQQGPIAVKIVAQSSASPVVRPTGSMVTEPTTPPAAAPIIRVSIGRIEVRAIMPQPPPAPRPKVARPSPGLSLEEYLKQRQRGQR